MKSITKKNLVCAGMAIAMTFAAWLPTTARAQDETKPMKPMKGGEHQDRKSTRLNSSHG